MNQTRTEKIFTFGKIKVKATNPNKIYFPGDGVTKGDVINYYISMADYIFPYLKGRPESLLRNPNGIDSKRLFSKRCGRKCTFLCKTSKRFFLNQIIKISIISYVIISPRLTYLNNLGCIEINPWHSTVEALDKPDYLIIDIDPSEKNTFDQVIEAANVVKAGS